MPLKFPEQEYLKTVEDNNIPEGLGSKRNKILTPKGLRELAQYYKEKYEIEIVPFGDTMKNAPMKINQLMNERKANCNQEFYRCGFIFVDIETGEHGHGMPIIWEKKCDIDNLFFLDTGQFLGLEYATQKSDLIVYSSFTKKTDFGKLPGFSPTAYVISKTDVYYIDRASRTTEQLSVNAKLFGLNPKEINVMHSIMQKVKKQYNIQEGGCIQLSAEMLAYVKSVTHQNVDALSMEPKIFRDELKKLNPNVSMWSNVGKRQIDITSCMTDAMVVLKDGLRLESSLEEHALSKYIEKVDDVHYFYMPEELLKTAQISSFAGIKSNANPDKVISFSNKAHNVDEGKNSAKCKTLKDYRDRYEIETEVNGKLKKFGYFTIDKANKYPKIIEKRWADNQLNEMKKVLSILRSIYLKFQFDKNYQDLNESIYIRTLKSDDVDQAKELLLKILDYIAMVKEDKLKYSPELIMDANATKCLLKDLCLDDQYKKIYERMKKESDNLIITCNYNQYYPARKLANTICQELIVNDESHDMLTFNKVKK